MASGERKSSSSFLGARARREFIANTALGAFFVAGGAAFVRFYHRPVVFAARAAASGSAALFQYQRLGKVRLSRKRGSAAAPYSVEAYLGAPNREFFKLSAAAKKEPEAGAMEPEGPAADGDISVGKGRKRSKNRRRESAAGSAEKPPAPEAPGPYEAYSEALVDAVGSDGRGGGPSMDEVLNNPARYAVSRPFVSLDEAILMGKTATAAGQAEVAPGAPIAAAPADVSTCFCLKRRDVGVDSSRPECGGLGSPEPNSLHACDPDNPDIVLIGLKAHFIPPRAPPKNAVPWGPTLTLAVREVYGAVALVVVSMIFLWIAERSARTASVGAVGVAVAALFASAGLGAHMLLWQCYQIEDFGGAAQGTLVRVAGGLLLASSLIRVLLAWDEYSERDDLDEAPSA